MCVPDIVQMMARKLIMRATPSGKSVIFWIPHATSFGWNFGLVMAATGMVMITMARQMMLTIVPTELNLAIQSVGMLLKHACDSMMRVVRRYVCQSVGTYSGCMMEAVAKIMEASEGVSLSIPKCLISSLTASVIYTWCSSYLHKPVAPASDPCCKGSVLWACQDSCRIV